MKPIVIVILEYGICDEWNLLDAFCVLLKREHKLCDVIAKLPNQIKIEEYRVEVTLR